MKKLKLVNQLRKLKQKEVDVYDLGGEFHKLGSGPLLSLTTFSGSTVLCYCLVCFCL